jgi:hypothetical protein
MQSSLRQPLTIELQRHPWRNAMPRSAGEVERPSGDTAEPFNHCVVNDDVASSEPALDLRLVETKELDSYAGGANAILPRQTNRIRSAFGAPIVGAEFWIILQLNCVCASLDVADHAALEGHVLDEAHHLVANPRFGSRRR